MEFGSLRKRNLTYSYGSRQFKRMNRDSNNGCQQNIAINYMQNFWRPFLSTYGICGCNGRKFECYSALHAQFENLIPEIFAYHAVVSRDIYDIHYATKAGSVKLFCILVLCALNTRVYRRF